MGQQGRLLARLALLGLLVRFDHMGWLSMVAGNAVTASLLASYTQTGIITRGPDAQEDVVLLETNSSRCGFLCAPLERQFSCVPASVWPGAVHGR